jgi:hypothetical protein
MTVVYPDVVARLLDLIEQEVLENAARKAASEGASAAVVALLVELATEQLRARRDQHLAGTSLWIERELGGAAIN